MPRPFRRTARNIRHIRARALARSGSPGLFLSSKQFVHCLFRGGAYCFELRQFFGVFVCVLAVCKQGDQSIILVIFNHYFRKFNRMFRFPLCLKFLSDFFPF